MVFDQGDLLSLSFGLSVSSAWFLTRVVFTKVVSQSHFYLSFFSCMWWRCTFLRSLKIFSCDDELVWFLISVCGAGSAAGCSGQLQQQPGSCLHGFASQQQQQQGGIQWQQIPECGSRSAARSGSGSGCSESGSEWGCTASPGCWETGYAAATEWSSADAWTNR